MNDIFKRIPIIYSLLLGFTLTIISLVIFPNKILPSLESLQKIYPSLLMPHKNYLYIGAISIFWLITNLLYIEYFEKNQRFKQIFDHQLKEIVSIGCLMTIFWIVSWLNHSLLLSLIFIAAATNYLLKGIRIISQNSQLRQNSWLIKFPSGFFVGWLIFETVVTLFAYMKSVGITFSGILWVIVAIMTVLLLALFSSYYYAKYGNGIIMIAIILGVFGLAIQHHNKQFPYANNMIFICTLAIGVIMVALFIYLTHLNNQQHQKSRSEIEK